MGAADPPGCTPVLSIPPRPPGREPASMLDRRGLRDVVAGGRRRRLHYSVQSRELRRKVQGSVCAEVERLWLDFQERSVQQVRAGQRYAELDQKRSVGSPQGIRHVDGLREFLSVERKRIPARILSDADRSGMPALQRIRPLFRGGRTARAVNREGGSKQGTSQNHVTSAEGGQTVHHAKLDLPSNGGAG
jgi:hypothetical protein